MTAASDGHGGRSSAVTLASSATNARTAGVSPVASVATVGSAGIAGLVGPFTTGIELVQPPATWGWLIALALVGQVLSWVLIGIGSPRLAPNATGALLLLAPVLAVGFAIVVLGEAPTVAQLVGCVVVVVAVWVANRARG